jgi:sensor histidine kinase YesM
MNEIQPGNKRPTPIPPYAHLLMYSLLIAGVDTGLLALRRLHQNEKRQEELEKRNAEMQLDILRHQVSPHFLMNTLNNIYGLMDIDVPRARESVIKLSRLMRFMLYENSSGKVRISKEFEFISSYIELMRLRYPEGVSIHLHLPEQYPDLEIPPLLFISYIENAFKHGVSYQSPSRIDIGFEVDGDRLRFFCNNTLHKETSRGVSHGGVGLKNSESRLKLLFGNAFHLQIAEAGNLFSVLLLIPLS